jgi:Phospholipase/Carboxylesterase
MQRQGQASVSSSAPPRQQHAMASLKFSYPAPTVIKPSQPHTATVIVMHGLGDTAAGWAPVGSQLKGALPHVKWVFPTAPTVRPARRTHLSLAWRHARMRLPVDAWRRQRMWLNFQSVPCSSLSS